MATQKVALITAGTAGLGAQIARTFAPDFRVVRPSFIHIPDNAHLTRPGHKLRKQHRTRRVPPDRTRLDPQHFSIAQQPTLPRHPRRRRRQTLSDTPGRRDNQHNGPTRRRRLERRLDADNQLFQLRRRRARRGLGQVLPVQRESAPMAGARGAQGAGQERGRVYHDGECGGGQAQWQQFAVCGH